MSAELRNRLLIGPLLGGLAIGLLVWDISASGAEGATSGTYWGTVLLAVLVTLTAPREYARLVRSFAPGVQVAPIVVCTLLMVAAVYPLPQMLDGHLTGGLPAATGTIVLSLGLVWICLAQMAKHALDHFVQNVATSMLGLVYIGVAMQLLAELSANAPGEDLARGPKLLMLAIATCKFGDIAAFFGGKTFGKHKMAPRISPGKTWEGFVSSLFGSVGGAFLIDWVLLQQIFGQPAFDAWWQLVIWGLILGPCGVLGDLVESCFKRSADMKDSGDLIPGFGGFLDVFDAVLIAAPVACALALIL